MEIADICERFDLGVATGPLSYVARGELGRVSRLADGSGKYLVNTHPRNWRAAGEGPEYENAWALGTDCGVGELDAVIKANFLCNDLGMGPAWACCGLYRRRAPTSRRCC